MLDRNISFIKDIKRRDNMHNNIDNSIRQGFTVLRQMLYNNNLFYDYLYRNTWVLLNN